MKTVKDLQRLDPPVPASDGYLVIAEWMQIMTCGHDEPASMEVHKSKIGDWGDDTKLMEFAEERGTLGPCIVCKPQVDKEHSL